MLDEHLTAKLADFGFSIQMPETVGNVTLINARDGLPGTNGYRPPEFSDGNYSVRSDIYSLGVVSVCLFVCACVWGGGVGGYRTVYIHVWYLLYVVSIL